MTLPYRTYFSFILLTLFCSCAVSYKPISHNFNYNKNIILKNGILIQHDTIQVFNKNSNKRFFKKAARNGILFVPIRIVNNSKDTLILYPQNLKVFCNYEEAQIVSKSAYYRILRQKPEIYGSEVILGISMTILLKASLIEWYNPYNILIWCGVYNSLKAMRENKELRSDIDFYDVLEKKIAPSDTLNGFLCIKASSMNNLIIRLK